MNASETGKKGAFTLSRLGATDSSNLNGDGGVCVRSRAYMHVSACVCDLFAIYDNYISPKLIMIIINFFILYFTQISHTDDFPSTGTRLVIIIRSNA